MRKAAYTLLVVFFSKLIPLNKSENVKFLSKKMDSSSQDHQKGRQPVAKREEEEEDEEIRPRRWLYDKQKIEGFMRWTSISRVGAGMFDPTTCLNNGTQHGERKRLRLSFKASNSPRVPVTGLHNLGNSCFMNSVLQTLTYIPPLRNFIATITKQDSPRYQDVQGFDPLNTLKRLFDEVSSNKRVVSPDYIFRNLKRMCAWLCVHKGFGRNGSHFGRTWISQWEKMFCVPASF